MAKLAPDGVWRAARAGACRGCGGPVMRGLDDDRCAIAVAVDPHPLSPAGELAALLAGRDTYTLTWLAGRSRYEIDRRYSENIEHSPPGTAMNRDVVAEHQCDAPPFDVAHIARTGHTHRASKALPLDPPF